MVQTSQYLKTYLKVLNKMLSWKRPDCYCYYYLTQLTPSGIKQSSWRNISIHLHWIFWLLYLKSNGKMNKPLKKQSKVLEESKYTVNIIKITNKKLHSKLKNVKNKALIKEFLYIKLKISFSFSCFPWGKSLSVSETCDLKSKISSLKKLDPV